MVPDAIQRSSRTGKTTCAGDNVTHPLKAHRESVGDSYSDAHGIPGTVAAPGLVSGLDGCGSAILGRRRVGGPSGTTSANASANAAAAAVRARRIRPKPRPARHPDAVHVLVLRRMGV